MVLAGAGALAMTLGRVEEAIGLYHRAFERDPSNSTDYGNLGLALHRADRSVEAEEAYRLWALAVVHRAMVHGAESDAALREMIQRYSGDSAHQIAEVHGARAEADAAFEWLERACLQRDGGLAEMKASPLLRSLHCDPRWGTFLKKMGFKE